MSRISHIVMSFLVAVQKEVDITIVEKLFTKLCKLKHIFNKSKKDKLTVITQPLTKSKEENQLKKNDFGELLKPCLICESSGLKNRFH